MKRTPRSPEAALAPRTPLEGEGGESPLLATQQIKRRNNVTFTRMLTQAADLGSPLEQSPDTHSESDSSPYLITKQSSVSHLNLTPPPVL